MSWSADDLDMLLADRLQDGIALETNPYAALAAETGLTEQDIVDRIRRLKENGALTRFGPMFNADRMGGAFCLCAMSVPAGRFDEVAEIVNGFREVAHNYEREHQLNMWFVLATETVVGAEEAASAIEAATGLQVYRFPKETEYFIGLKVAV